MCSVYLFYNPKEAQQGVMRIRERKSGPGPRGERERERAGLDHVSAGQRARGPKLTALLGIFRNVYDHMRSLLTINK